MRPADMDDIQLTSTTRPRLAAVISDRQPDVLIANDDQVPPPHRRASPPQGDACQAPVSRDLPPGWVGHPPCNGLPVYGDRAKGAGKRQKRPNKSL
jgi:hypothetical protein